MPTDPDATSAQSLERTAAAPPPGPGLRGGLARVFTGRLTLDDLWLILPLVMALIFLVNRQIHPADFWWHVRTGQIIVETGHIPTTDLFTFTRAGQPWTNQGWLMQVFLYLVLRAGGLPLILAVHAITITAGYLLVELACLRVAGGRPRPVALATIAAMAIGIVHWNVRPQSISYLCFGVVLYIITRARSKPTRLIWVLPPLFAVWVNLHGGFVFGLGLLGIYTMARVAGEWLDKRRLDREAWRHLACGTASLMALAFNPGGPVQAIRYVVSFLASNATLQKNLEFQPLSIREADGLVFFAGLLLTLVVLWRLRAAPPTDQIAVLIIFGLAGLYTRRIVPWYGMALGPVLAWALSRFAVLAPPNTSAGKPALNYAVLGVMAALLVVFSPWARPYIPTPISRAYLAEDVTPTEAARWLCEQGPQIRPFTDVFFASHLAWTCPTVPTFMDTRFELYPTAMWQDYLRIINGQFGWEERLAHYDVNALFVQKESEKELIAAARASGRWQTTYEDQFAIIMQRISGPAAP